MFTLVDDYSDGLANNSLRSGSEIGGVDPIPMNVTFSNSSSGTHRRQHGICLNRSVQKVLDASHTAD